MNEQGWRQEKTLTDRGFRGVIPRRQRRQGLALAALLGALAGLAAPVAARAATGDPQVAAAARAAVEPYRETVASIVAEALASGQAFERLSELVVAAPHRLSGSKGAAAAVAWARRAMIADGLQNVRLQRVAVPHWERGDVCELTFVEPAGLAGHPLAAIALGGSEATPAGGLSAEVVEVAGLDQATALGQAARGKIVFYNRPMDASRLDSFSAYGGAVDQRGGGAIAAARQGALAVLVRSMTTRLDDVPHTGAMHYAKDVPRIPAAAVSTRAAEQLSALLTAGQGVRLRFTQSGRWHPDATSANVIGELVGSEKPDEIVLVGGHLDAWDVGQGAHDDGAGCCQAIEALRLLSSMGLRPRRTLRAVLFMNEENGLRGGRAYRDKHQDEMARHVLALESDRGGFTPRGFTTNAGPQAKAVLDAIAELLAEAGAGRMLAGNGGADISPMGPDGVVLAGYLPDAQRYFDLHHSARDTLEQVSPRELHLGVGVIAALLYVVADLPERLPPNPVASEQAAGSR